MADVLNSLKELLLAAEAKAADAAAEANDLRVAINAIEAGRADSPIIEQRPRRKRGDLKKAVLNAVREGKGTRKQIAQAVADAGIEVSSNSVSMAINRLQKLIILNPEGNRYMIRDQEGCREALMGQLRASAQIAEGSKVVALKPSGRNGAAGVHPPTTALHTAST